MYLSKKDEIFYERQKRKEIKQKEAYAKAYKRGEASKQWHRLHPEGITQSNFQDFKNYIKQAEKQ